MNYVWWTVTILLMLVGLAGTVLPLLPGTTIILAAAVLHHLTMPAEQTVGWWTIGGLALLTAISYVIDFVSGTVGAKWFGATRWGAIGGLIGAVVGLFFGIIGVFVGPLVGVLVGELLGGKGLLPAGKSTWGTVLGTTAGIILRFAIAVIMVGWFFLATVGLDFLPDKAPGRELPASPAPALP
ncbi:MAG: DUF456 family protein [Verrucomicrobiaceae bacterium]|nr:MAG: DUF456 family protein [Verrucomicrobiaceae bacterium]